MPRRETRSRVVGAERDPDAFLLLGSRRNSSAQQQNERALALTITPHDAGGQTAADWTALREEVLLNSLQAHLFLARETYATVPEAYRDLITVLPDSANKAVLLCTFAESDCQRGEHWRSVWTVSFFRPLSHIGTFFVTDA